MTNEAPATTAALQGRIADLEQQLKLSDEGVSRLAQRCLALEQEVQACAAAHPQREMRTDSPTLLQPLLYYDTGFGFSEKDTLTAERLYGIAAQYAQLTPDEKDAISHRGNALAVLEQQLPGFLAE